MKLSLSSFLGVLALCAFATGCAKPTFHPTTNAPPGAVAEYDENTETGGGSVHLTEGVAMALECTNKEGGACSLDGSRVDDESIASVRKAYGDFEQKLVYTGTANKQYQNRSFLVVIAKKPGKTRMNVITGKGDAVIEIDVKPR